jgi:hypothetical protein
MKRTTLYVTLFLVPIILLVAGYYIIPNLMEPLDNNEWTHRGQFGDMFGVVNALFSGLAFAGLIVTIIMQRDELSLQRQELSLTRKEMEDTRKEFEQQNDTLKKQRFENTYFNLVTLHHKIFDESIGHRNFFRGLLDEIKMFESIQYTSHKTYWELEIIFNTKISGQQNEDAISLYLNSIHQVAKYVYISDLSDNDKLFYNNILISNLSEAERTFIFYYVALSRNSKNEVDKLLELDKLNGFVRILNPFFFNASQCILISLLHHREVLLNVKPFLPND